jgi:type III restriction enzyme
MELKQYQQRVIDDLADYLSALQRTPHLANAFKNYWSEKGILKPDAYKNNVPGVPHICAKVPTAGGKTYLAVNALKTIFDAFRVLNPQRAPFVVWLVPSLTILEQTVNCLADSAHPYRQRLNQLFKGRVAIYEKRDLLLGAGFSADTVREQLSIVVMSFDSLRARNKEDRKIYQDNGYLASFLSGSAAQDSGDLLPEYDASALINVLRRLQPVVVVDESHNAETALSVEMLVNLNPQFILDLTATPKQNSNIISYVDAMALKRDHMVKLPVIVANQSSRDQVIESALILRRQLEAIALAEEQQGGQYIRPIVLFQAQPRTGEDKTTFEKIKAQLIALCIPEEQIKIKTAEINELKGIDLMRRDCPVRYIITVNALKEGWDCPFAYVLASLADKSSAVDVEQILGRVLRMPHVQQHSAEMLNMSYVFTASSRFMETIQSVVRALHRSGFSRKDCRALEFTLPLVEDEAAPSLVQADLPGTTPTANVEAESIEASDGASTAPDEPESAAPVGSAADFVAAVTRQAVAAHQTFEAQANASASESLPAELEEKMNKHHLKEIFCAEAQALKLPQFFIRAATGGMFDAANALQLFEKSELLKDFKLSQADGNIGFEDVDAEMYLIDLETHGEQDYAPMPTKIDAAGRARFNHLILAGSRDAQVRDVTARMIELIGKTDTFSETEIKKYVQRIVEALPPEQIRDCLQRDLVYAKKIKQKIETLGDAHAAKGFVDWLDVDRIVIQPQFVFPASIAPSANAPALPKSLYSTEAAINGFESRVINDIANLENIQWWHRNLSRGKGFCINGFLNHYPDFILKTKTGRIIVLETKGDDRDNTDSALKLKLGKLWEAKAGPPFKFMMLFDNNPIEGAERLSDALKKLAQF